MLQRFGKVRQLLLQQETRCSLWKLASYHWATTVDRHSDSNVKLAAMLRWFTAGGAIRIAVRQLLQNRKLRHWWRHNLGSRRKLQKMARENSSIHALYNITKNQHNSIKTVGRDSFLSPKTPKNTSFLGVTQPPGVAQPLYSRGHN